MLRSDCSILFPKSPTRRQARSAIAASRPRTSAARDFYTCQQRQNDQDSLRLVGNQRPAGG